MSSSNEDQKPMDNMELLKQQASACGPGCACHGTGSSGRKRLILGMIVLLVAVALVARAVIKTNTAPSQPDAATFTSPIVAQTPSAESAAAAPPVNSQDGGYVCCEGNRGARRIEHLGGRERCCLCVRAREGRSLQQSACDGHAERGEQDRVPGVQDRPVHPEGGDS